MVGPRAYGRLRAKGDVCGGVVVIGFERLFGGGVVWGAGVRIRRL